ncbi:MAG: efflux RND transporter periplasmic adaptor subunit [Treponema sp.]|jgi:multidrug efflux pump subunit AcrA (membrane-fusion protein)|nr:efflux RND transporter periplasmic adaptor subunit [Treponema sp.]
MDTGGRLAGLYGFPNGGASPKKKSVFISAPIGILLFAVTAVLCGCEQLKGIQDTIRTMRDGEPSVQSAPEEPVFAVNTTAAVQGQIQDYLALSGDVVAGSSVDAYSDIAGRITRLYVSVGSRVRRGDPIAEVDPSRPGMEYVPGIARAPIAGTIVSLPAQVGMTVTQSVPLARLTGSSALELRVYVAERFISKIRTGLPCEVTLDAWPGEVFSGSIREISPVVDAASRTMEVRISVANTGSRLKVGMFAKVKIITERKSDIVKIPAGAMIQRFGENFLFTVEADPEEPSVKIARRKTIKPGILIDNVLEIQEGLKPEEEVIVRGQTLLEDGARVNVIDKIAPLAATY